MRAMKKNMMLKVLSLLLLLVPRMASAQPRMLCAAQFALANKACAFATAEEPSEPPPSPPASEPPPPPRASRPQPPASGPPPPASGPPLPASGPPPPSPDAAALGPSSHEFKEHGLVEVERQDRGHDRRRGRSRDDDDDHDHDHHHHDHHHDHHDHHDHHHPRVNRDCCRRLKELDDECVCGALLRLPLSLTKPTHDYSIAVGTTCKVSFKCGGL